jgi:hypothetical protein
VSQSTHSSASINHAAQPLFPEKTKDFFVFPECGFAETHGGLKTRGVFVAVLVTEAAVFLEHIPGLC